METPSPNVGTNARVFHYGTLALGTCVLAVLARGQWFFGDEWDPLMQRSVFGSAPKNLLEPHNEHWSTIAVLVYRAHLALFGLRTYAPLMVLFIAVCVITAHVLWCFCLRVGADPYVASVLVLCFLCFGPAAGELTFAWNFTFVGALGCGFGILLLMRPAGPFTARDARAAWGLGVVALMLSGIALTMLAVVFLAALTTRGWKVAMALVSVPALAYVIWVLGWGHEGGSLTSTKGLHHVPDVVGTGLTFGFDEFTRVPFAGATLLVGLAVYVAAAWRSWRSPRVWALASAAGAVVFYAIVALRRDSQYLPGPKTGRYLLMAFALFTPLLSLALTDLARRARVLTIVGAVVATALVGVQVGRLVDAAHDERDRKQAELRRVTAAARLVREHIPTVNDVVLGSTAFERSVTVPRIERLDAQDKLPHPRLDEVDLLGARADLQVAFGGASSHDGDDDAPARIVRVRDARLTPAPNGCIVVTPVGRDPWLVFRPGNTTTAAVVDAAAPFGLHVVVRRDGVRSARHDVIAFTPAPYRLRLAAAPTDVELSLPDTPSRVCHMTADPSLMRG